MANGKRSLHSPLFSVWIPTYSIDSIWTIFWLATQPFFHSIPTMESIWNGPFHQYFTLLHGFRWTQTRMLEFHSNRFQAHSARFQVPFRWIPSSFPQISSSFPQIPSSFPYPPPWLPVDSNQNVRIPFQQIPSSFPQIPSSFPQIPSANYIYISGDLIDIIHTLNTHNSKESHPLFPHPFHPLLQLKVKQ